LFKDQCHSITKIKTNPFQNPGGLTSSQILQKTINFIGSKEAKKQLILLMKKKYKAVLLYQVKCFAKIKLNLQHKPNIKIYNRASQSHFRHLGIISNFQAYAGGFSVKNVLTI